MTSNRDLLPYRPCVGICLMNADKHVFVGQRIDSPGAWQMPQGGVDNEEDISHAAFRELAEETGITQVELLRIAEEKIRYDVPYELSVKHWGGQYRGQEQTWVAMRFTGNDADVRLDAHEPQEFSHWQWVPLANTVDLIVPFKRDTYRKVVSLFEDLVR